MTTTETELKTVHTEISLLKDNPQALYTSADSKLDRQKRQTRNYGGQGTRDYGYGSTGNGKLIRTGIRQSGTIKKKINTETQVTILLS